MKYTVYTKNVKKFEDMEGAMITKIDDGVYEVKVADSEEAEKYFRSKKMKFEQLS